MADKESWDVVFPTSQAVKQEAQSWLDNIDAWSGRLWWSRPSIISLHIDALAVEYGGFICAEGQRRLLVAGTFSHEESKLSSTARKMIGYTRALEITAQHRPQDMNQSSVLLQGDSQAALAALKKLASSNTIIHEHLKRLFSLCATHNFDIIPRWVPREKLAEADKLSRRPEVSDWGCSKELVALIQQQFRITIDVDMFASEGHHVSSRFVSAFFTPGCLVVHALARRWRPLLSSPTATAWVFPPTKSITSALSIIESERINTILIVPTRTTSNEWIQLQHLTAEISAPFHIPRRREFCQPSLRVPHEAINPALMGLTAFSIHWPDVTGERPEKYVRHVPKYLNSIRAAKTQQLLLRNPGRLSNFSTFLSPSLSVQ
jgi:hypothetical protein